MSCGNNLRKTSPQTSLQTSFANSNNDDNKNSTDDKIDVDLLYKEFKYVDGRLMLNIENSCEKVFAVDEKANKYIFVF